VLSYPSAMTVSSRAVNLLGVVARGDHEGAGQVGSRAVRSCAYLTVPVVLAGSSVFRGCARSSCHPLVLPGQMPHEPGRGAAGGAADSISAGVTTRGPGANMIGRVVR
jgi:hypothetical protein